MKFREPQPVTFTASLDHLDPGYQELVHAKIREIMPIINEHPELRQADLVIEAGIGDSVILAHALRTALPDAMHMALDIFPRFRVKNRRQKGGTNPEEIEGIIAANANPSLKLREAIMYGNAYDTDLVRDIMRQTGKSRPILVSSNCLGALVRREIDGTPKEECDFRTFADIASIGVPYDVQWHILGDAVANTALSTEAAKQGWRVIAEEQSLILIKP